ncbi:MAG: RNA-binding protein, partial [Sedimenticolaceae bacterium]
MNIYVGNLAYTVTEDELREAFSAFGEVSRANVIMDRDTGRSKGFGFVEMPDDSQAEAAIAGLNE